MERDGGGFKDAFGGDNQGVSGAYQRSRGVYPGEEEHLMAKGTVHQWKHEMAVCKCGAEFSRTVWSGKVRVLCDRCVANRHYKLNKRRNK